MLKIFTRNRTKNPLLFRALALVQVTLEIFAHNRTENHLFSRATARVLDMLKIFAHNCIKFLWSFVQSHEKNLKIKNKIN
jgi:hypothetical protein